MDTTTPKPYAFVLMPFAEEFNDVYDGIKQACQDAGVIAERADEDFHTNDIMQMVYTNIKKADLIIAEMSNKNPNVYYEVGYAHALGKKVILLVRESIDIPFDLNHYPHIIYRNQIAKRLRPELTKSIRLLLAKPETEVFSKLSHLKCYFDGEKITENGKITIKPKGLSSSIPPSTLSPIYQLQIDLHNEIDTSAKNINFQFGLILPNEITVLPPENYININSIKLPDGGVFCLFERRLSLDPGMWQSININFLFNINKNKKAQSCKMRFFADNEILDLDFLLKFDEPNIPMGNFEIERILQSFESKSLTKVPLGYDLDRMDIFQVDLTEFNIFSILGIPKSGKTTLLNIWLKVIASLRPLNKSRLFVIDYQNSLEIGIKQSINDYKTINNNSDLASFIPFLEQILMQPSSKTGFIFLIIDDAHLIDQKLNNSLCKILVNHQKNTSLILLVSSAKLGYFSREDLEGYVKERGVKIVLGTNDFGNFNINIVREMMPKQHKISVFYPGVGYFITRQNIKTVRFANFDGN